MKKFFCYSTLLIIVFCSCKNSQTTSPGASPNEAGPSQNTPQLTNPTTLEGNWIATSFVNRVTTSGSVLAANRNPKAMPYALAFTFLPHRLDSILCYDHFRRWLAPIKISVDTIELPGVVNGKSIFMVYQSSPEKAFMMFDPTSGDLVQHYFVQTREKTVNGYVAFATALNHNLLGGGFKKVGSKDPKDFVSFSPTGGVTGLADYKLYQVCAGGDCLLAGDKIDCIFLSNPQKQKGSWHGFRYSGEMDTLTIYRLDSKTPTVKGSWEVKEPVFKLARLPKQEGATTPGPQVKKPTGN